MKLAASQIAWQPAEEDQALALLRGLHFSAVEIAPGRVAGQAPYTKPELAAAFAARVGGEYGLSVCSLQSIWFGQTGSLFGPERLHFIEYTKAAVCFAAAAGAGNLVFGNPKNRVRPKEMPEAEADGIAAAFFREMGDYAAAQGAVLALEANPPEYGTNFMNATSAAFAMAQRAASPGCRVNLDLSTILLNGEDLESLRGKVGQINHVHISEPHLAPTQRRPQHRQLAEILAAEGYRGYISLEMRTAPLETLRAAAEIVAEVFA